MGDPIHDFEGECGQFHLVVLRSIEKSGAAPTGEKRSRRCSERARVGDDPPVIAETCCREEVATGDRP